MMRLQKFLAQAGIASRRKAEELIRAGKVMVNRQVATKLGITVDENDDEIVYNGKVVSLVKNKIYFSLNKPIGYISSASRQQGKSVMDLIKTKERVYPVGRLDKDSSGLIILTNDGEFANLVTHPRYGCSKEYFAVLNRDLVPADIIKLEKGLMIDGKKAKAKIVMAKNQSVRLILNEGLNRQIRKMLGQLGYEVKKLKRIKIGKLELGDLPEGQSRTISKNDVID
jgi:23S rRNA pseudouridine2605 synthase